MTDNERRAFAVGSNRKALLRRLLDTRLVLTREFRAMFRPYKFDFAKKRLVSADGRICLQWRLRDRPDLPVSYENQQTNIGSVSLEVIDARA